MCTTLYRNPMQVTNFGGTFDQLFLRIFYKIFTKDASQAAFTRIRIARYPDIRVEGTRVLVLVGIGIVLLEAQQADLPNYRESHVQKVTRMKKKENKTERTRVWFSRSS